MSDVDDLIKDWQEEPWHCELHDKDAKKDRQGNKDLWGCPDCLEIIDNEWEQWRNWKAEAGLAKVQDSGSRSEYATGAQRDNHAGKGRFDLIPPEAMFRIARWFEGGALKYEDRNWEKGIPVSRCIDACIRHAFKYLAGWNDEDHLAAVIWNAMAIMFYEEKLPSCQDLPEWKDKTNIGIRRKE